MYATALLGRRSDAAPARLMVVDDSIVVRSVLQAILATAPDFTVAATASSAEQALAALDRSPVDIVVLDLAMPGIGGLDALPEIIRRGQGARVLVVSASAGTGAAACVRALTLGAADTLEKPRAGGFSEAFNAEFIVKLRRIAAGLPARAATPDAVVPPPPPVALRPPGHGAIGCLAIGASTGGLPALTDFFRALPARFTAPILVTQHLPASFMPYFAAQMGAIAGRTAAVARDGDPLTAGAILIAPGDAHLRLRADGDIVRVLLDRAPAPSGCLPSVDPMLEAVAERFGTRGYAVVLTGMGRDGTIGAHRLAIAGGEIAAQDRATSAVWGMPGSVAAAGLASIVAAPALLAERIATRIGLRGAHRVSLR